MKAMCYIVPVPNALGNQDLDEIEPIMSKGNFVRDMLCLEKFEN